MSVHQSIGTFAGKMPVASPFLATSLGLRPDSYQFRDELAAAYDANGKQTSVLNREAVKNGLLQFWAKKRPSLTGSALEQFVKARHPNLFLASIAKIGTGLNERQAANEVLATGPTMKFA